MDLYRTNCKFSEHAAQSIAQTTVIKTKDEIQDEISSMGKPLLKSLQTDLYSEKETARILASPPLVGLCPGVLAVRLMVVPSATKR